MSLQEVYNIRPSWWGQQPRCTAKTGWITTAAHAEGSWRAALQVAACKLGIARVVARQAEKPDIAASSGSRSRTQGPQ